MPRRFVKPVTQSNFRTARFVKATCARSAGGMLRPVGVCVNKEMLKAIATGTNVRTYELLDMNDIRA